MLDESRDLILTRCPQSAKKRGKGHPLSGTKGDMGGRFRTPSWSDPELGSFCAEETECVGHYSFEAKR